MTATTDEQTPPPRAPWEAKALEEWHSEDERQLAEHNERTAQAHQHVLRWAAAAMGPVVHDNPPTVEAVEPVPADGLPTGTLRMVLRWPDEDAGYSDDGLYGAALLVTEGRRGMVLQAGVRDDDNRHRVRWHDVTDSPTAADVGRALLHGPRPVAAQREETTAELLLRVLRALVDDAVVEAMEGKL